jgi:hypothetical protein
MKFAAAMGAILAVAAVAWGDVIELHNGTKIECTIVLEDGKKVFYKVNGQTEALSLEEVSGIIRSAKKPLKTPDEVKADNPGNHGSVPENGSENPAEPPTPGSKAVPAKENAPEPPAAEESEEEHPLEARVAERPAPRITDGALNGLFGSLKETCEALNASSTDEERTFYRMRAIILEKHINSCGYTAGRIALGELEDMPLPTWKEKQLYTGFLAEIVAGCHDRDIIPYFWEEWMPVNIKRVRNTHSGEFALALIKKIVADLEASHDNTYRSVKYRLKPFKFRGAQRYMVEKTPMGMPK